MTTEEKIKVMQAYVDGKLIEISEHTKNEWIGCIEPIWDWAANDYRIKPEPTYRPYKDTAEMIADYDERFNMLKLPPHVMPMIWVKRKDIYEYSLITDYNDDAVCMSDTAWDFKELLERFTYLDGSPVGKMVE